MELLLDLLTPVEWLWAVAIAVLAGFVKGVVGFAMPMVMISGLSSVLTPELALAALILPTLVSNWLQAMRQGARAAWDSLKRFRVFLVVGGLALFLSAQLVTVLSVSVMLAVIGLPITAFAVAQIAGWKGDLPAGPSRRLEVGIAAFAGAMGGVSGVWGPPTVAYLTALDTEKREQIRIQGVIYGLGALALVGAHLGSGVLNTGTIWLSLALVPPAVLGMWLGAAVQDRFDQKAFKRATLWVLLIAGLNLLRRAFFA